MKSTIALFALVIAFGTGSVLAADAVKKEASPAQKAQQEKMKACNADAGKKELKGDERKKFMSACLKDKQKSQQDRMKSCNKDAGDKKLKGDERKGFMKDCLSAKK